MAKKSLEKAAVIPRGVWSSTKTYKRLDLVLHDGSGYMAIVESINEPVTNTDCWAELTPAVTAMMSGQ